MTDKRYCEGAASALRTGSIVDVRKRKDRFLARVDAEVLAGGATEEEAWKNLRSLLDIRMETAELIGERCRKFRAGVRQGA